MVAVEAVYHKSCYTKFTYIPKRGSASNVAGSVGRPVNEDMQTNFILLCEWLESNACAEIYSLQELYEIMQETAGSSIVYSIKRLQQKLKDRYGEFIYFSSLCGKANVVCFRNMANFLINSTWYLDRQCKIEDETERIVKTASNLIRSEIRVTLYEYDVYSTDDDVSNPIKGSA